MQYSLSIWIVGCLAVVATTASEVLNGIVAFGAAATSDLILALRVLFLAAFGLTIIGVISLTYFIALFQHKVNHQKLNRSYPLWIVYGIGVAVAIIDLVISGVAIIWAVIARQSLPRDILYRPPEVWLYIWTGFWAISFFLQLTFFTILGRQTMILIAKRGHAYADRPHGTNKRRSLKVDTTRGRSLAAPAMTPTSFPRSPSTNATSSLRDPSSTRFPTAANSRTKLIGKHSAQSSIDPPSPPIGEVLRMEAFEQWDAAAAHPEMRSAVAASPVTPKPAIALDPIPGSRPTSPTNPLDVTLEILSTPARTELSETSTLGELSSPTSRHRSLHKIPSSPPSSPPNFSRPTSKSNIRKFASSTDMRREEHVHPLFRSTSPLPPPLATMGTTVTVEDHNSPITPRSLARLRNSSLQERGLRHVSSYSGKGHWRGMSSVDASSTRPSTAESIGLGSPGPSVADEAELPPILPGFVLGAGSRSSLIGYSSRKSSRKEKGPSRVSYAE